MVMIIAAYPLNAHKFAMITSLYFLNELSTPFMNQVCLRGPAFLPLTSCAIGCLACGVLYKIPAQMWFCDPVLRSHIMCDPLPCVRSPSQILSAPGDCLFTYEDLSTYVLALA